MPRTNRQVQRALKRIARQRRGPHASGWAGKAARGSYKTARYGVKHRNGLAPLYAVAAQAAAGGMLSAAPDGWKTALAIDAAVAASVLAWARFSGLRLPGKGKHRVLKRVRPGRKRTAWTAAASGTAGALITCMALTGGPGPYPGLLALWLTGFGIPWWRKDRKRGAGATPLDEPLRLWADHVAAKDGILPGAELEEPATTGYGWTATIVLPRGRGSSWKRAAEALDDIAGTYDTDAAHVIIERKLAPKGRPASERRATLSIFTTNSLQAPNLFPGPTEVFDPATGRAKIGVFHDGQPAHYQYWNKGSGAVHTFLVGTTDAGKSRLLDELLAIERHSPLMVSWVCDPQGGASLPEWMEAVDWFAPTARHGLLMLKAAREVMKERERVHARLKWIDAKGRERRGRSFFVAGDPFPLLVITIDEAPDVLKLPGAVEVFVELVREARKVGIKLRVVSQMPNASQLGASIDSTTIRELLQSGNAVCLRTGSTRSGRIALGGQMEVDTSLIPKYWPDGTLTAGLGYISGPDARTGMLRASYLEDPYEWTTTGLTTGLEKNAQEAAGDDYAKRLDVIAAHLRGEKVDPKPAALNAPAGDSGEPSARTAVEAFLRERGRPASLGVIGQHVDATRNNIKVALTRLKTDELAVSLGNGMWAHAEADLEPPQAQPHPDGEEAVA